MPSMFKLRFAFWTDGLPFDGRPIEQQSLGGSESALWHMARELAKRGHEVEVFCKCPTPGVYDGVAYHDNALGEFRKRAMTTEWDVFVAHRFYYVLDFATRARSKWLWMHDMPVDVRDLTAHLYDADQAIVLSEFHERAYLKEQPGLAPILWRSRNGIDLDLIQKAGAGIERKKNLLVYASRPERGLARLLLEVWPKLRERRPELELAVTSYDMTSYGFPEELRSHYAEIRGHMARTSGVVDCGALSKTRFYQLLHMAAGLIYPTSFPEISCIVALEAMAAGCPVLTTADFALTETVPYAAEFGTPDPQAKDYPGRFMAQALRVLDDPLTYKRLQKEGKTHVYARYRWEQVAAEWEERAYGIFEDRAGLGRKLEEFPDRALRVFDQLVYESDLVAARAFAEKVVCDNHTRPEAGQEMDRRMAWLDGVLSSHHEEPDAYCPGAGDPTSDDRWVSDARLVHVGSMIPKGKLRCIDVGCATGGLLACLHLKRPELRLTGVDFSMGLIDRARQFHVRAFGGNPVELLCADATTLPDGDYDVVTCTEVLEHQVDVPGFVAALERLARKGGRIILTVPSGPWEAMGHGKPRAESEADWSRTRLHVNHFTERDLLELFGAKKGFHLEFKPAGYSERGELLGWWFVAWENDGTPTGEIDYERKFLTTRPYQKLAYCMIVRNEEDNLARNLKSILPAVDEVHILDTGSTDGTLGVVERLQAEGRYRPEIFVTRAEYEDVRPVPKPRNGEEGPEHRVDRYIEENRLIAFDRARNRSIEAAISRGADWILWADADEVFKGARNIRKYLHTKISPSLIIRQNHLVLDPRAQPGVDKPFRLFRPHFGGRDVRFLGIVHEQPAFSANEFPDPALELPDVDIVHFGYLDQETVRWKCVARNLNLLRKDRFVYPDRILGRLLVMRDMNHIASFEAEKTGGKPTEHAIDMLRRSCTIYRETFADGKHSHHAHAFGFYQKALAMLAAFGAPVDPDEPGIPFEVEAASIVAPGGIPADTRRPAPMRRWFARRADYEAHLKKEVAQAFGQFGDLYAARDSGNDRPGSEVSPEALPREELRDARDPDPGRAPGPQRVPSELEAGGVAAGK